jgi:heme/copper-type cytochrome/quinol oxidase subunit 3
VKPSSVIDVSGLPTYAYGHRSLMWWGTQGIIFIEGTVFAIAIVAYFYLGEVAREWPPHGVPPSLTYGTINLVIMLASAVPNQLTKRWAEKEDLLKVRVGLVVCMAFALAFLTVRAFEFGALNTDWDESAYGSVVFALMVIHTVHLVTDTIDSAVLTVLMFTGPLEGRRFVDVSENALYWWFVVLAWIPVYLTVYIAPRV